MISKHSKFQWKLRFHDTSYRELSTTRQALFLYLSNHALVKQIKQLLDKKVVPLS